MVDDTISAQTMARAARQDPQFAVPARPRVRRGLSVRRYADHLVVDGAPTRHVLRGRSATQLVPRLLPLLDGVRDHAALAADLGVSTSTVFTALSLLWTCGVIEEGPPPTLDVGGVSEHLADFLSRVGDSTAANAAWEEGAARLTAARVRIVGDPAFAAALHTELSGSVTVTDAGAPTLIVAASTPTIPLDAALVAATWRQNIPLLRVDLRDDVVEIGPYVDRRLGPCLDCLTADRLEPDSQPDSQPTAGQPPTEPGADDLVLAAALAASDIVALISRAARVALPSRWRRVGLSRLAQSQCSGATRPGCPACSAVLAGQSRSAPLSARYEAAVALPPREYADLKGHQAHYQPANVALQRGHKVWPIAPRRALPAANLELLAKPPQPAAGRATASRPTADHLALLLSIVAGWQGETPERVWRWTASGGNIGSVVAHLLVRNVDGLEPGVYGYVPAAHELSLLREGPPPPCPPHCAGDACLLLTADLTRVAAKYGAFGLRIVLLDAGCAQTAALGTAEALGLPAHADLDFPAEQLGDLIGVDVNAEPVTTLIHLGGAR